MTRSSCESSSSLDRFMKEVGFEFYSRIKMYRLMILVACLASACGLTSSPTFEPSKISPSAATPTQNKTSSPVLAISTSVVILTTTLHTAMIASTTIAPSSPVAPTTKVPTTTEQPTTTPRPTTPIPKQGDYSVKDKLGNYCLLAKLKISFNISYYSNKTVKIGNKTNPIVQNSTFFSMPFKDFTNNGSKCNSNKSTLLVSWPLSNPLFVFEMMFGRSKDKDNVTDEWEVTEVSLTATTKDNPYFINANESKIKLFSENNTELGALSGRLNGSYLCGITKTFPFVRNGMMSVEYAQLQPFDVPANNNGTEIFGEETNCEQKKPKEHSSDSNIVPIAVGCALAGLVLIVLIAYIIGRRKSQRGYEKV